ncbi:MAG: DUF1490 domain-containing protein [Tissierellia bacterium]|nr:DUF1490 domain-containing protein [Tissierellia bacterium]
MFLNKKVLSFIGGVASTVVVDKVLKSKAAHDGAVKIMAKAINLKKSAAETYESMKEDADDLAFEAREEARRQKEAAVVVEEEPAKA